MKASKHFKSLYRGFDAVNVITGGFRGGRKGRSPPPLKKTNKHKK